MGIDESLRREIVRRILGVHQPEKIILFGSAATGPLTRDSDIDLLVVDRKIRDTREERLRIWDALRGLGRPCDVFVMEAEWFEESKEVFGGLAYPAHKYGHVIYEAT